MEQYIPHQLHLTPAQVSKIYKGLAFNLPYSQMGADKGQHILSLTPETAMKLLKSYKAGKGVRLALSPAEREHSAKHGRGLDIGKILNSPLGKKITDKVIDKAIDHALGGKGVKQGGALDLGKILNSPVGQKITDKIVDKAIDRAFGGRLPKGSPEAKERMARLRAMKKGGGDFFGNIGRAMKTSWNAPPATKEEQDVANFINKNLITKAPRIISTVNPEAGDVVGLALDPYLAERNRIDNSVQFGKGRGRGRPKKGQGVKESPAYKKAMKLNYGGVQLSKSVANEPVSKFSTNPKVRPSSSEMTLSPYQSITSPAMNPFVPKTSVEAGGTHPTGKGLYAGGLYAGGLF